MNEITINLKDKYVVLDPKDFTKPAIIDRIFYCEAGSGLYSYTVGNKIFGFFVTDHEDCYVRRPSVERLATDEEISEAKKKWKITEAENKKIKKPSQAELVESLNKGLQLMYKIYPNGKGIRKDVIENFDGDWTKWSQHILDIVKQGDAKKAKQKS
jgi:hypothetical protein